MYNTVLAPRSPELLLPGAQRGTAVQMVYVVHHRMLRYHDLHVRTVGHMSSYAFFLHIITAVSKKLPGWLFWQ